MSESLEITDIGPEQRNLLLLRCEKNGDAARRQLDQIQNLYDHMLELAQDGYEDAEAAWEVAYAALRVYDDESERSLADTAARVRSLEARLRHLKQDHPTPGLPRTPEDVKAVEDELAVARGADQAAVTARLEGRRPVADRARAARRELLWVGVKLWGLSSQLQPSLVQIQQHGEEAARLRNLPLKAEGKMRRLDQDARAVLERIDREPEEGELPSAETLRPLEPKRRAISVPRRFLGGADVHADAAVGRVSISPLPAYVRGLETGVSS